MNLCYQSLRDHRCRCGDIVETGNITAQPDVGWDVPPKSRATGNRHRRLICPLSVFIKSGPPILKTLLTFRREDHLFRPPMPFESSASDFKTDAENFPSRVNTTMAGQYGSLKRPRWDLLIRGSPVGQRPPLERLARILMT